MSELKRTFDSLWNSLVDVLPTILLGGALLIGGWILAKLLSILVLRLFKRKTNSKWLKFFSFDAINARVGTEIRFPKNYFKTAILDRILIFYRCGSRICWVEKCIA